MRVLELRDAPAPAVACERFLDLPRCALLESVGTPGDLCRYSFLAADPFRRLEAKGCRLTWSDSAGTRSEDGNPFEVLERELAVWSSEALAPALGSPAMAAPAMTAPEMAAPEMAAGASRLPPFRGGVLGYFGYDLLHHLERIPAPRHDDLQLPDLNVGFYDWVVAWDHLQGRAWILSTGLPEAEGAARERRAAERLEFVLGRLSSGDGAGWGGTNEDGADIRGATAMGTPAARGGRVAGGDSTTGEGSPPSVPGEVGGPPTFVLKEVAPGLRSTFSRAGYLAAVERAREYILAGDIFQVNLSQRLSLPCAEPAFNLYRRLRSANPAPFAAFLAGREAAVLSVSPERFLRLSGDCVETRPIKGTTARGYTPLHDFALGDDLVASEKDRAENVMIVDLLRNDLSRVALDGSVRVPALWRVERHPTIHHLVSTVTARLRPGLTAIDLLRATFPGGSITGAPKVRAMEIIHELESTRRGVYCGSIGYIGFDGEADLSIAIRTVTLKDGVAHFSVGGAVVADSDPAAEYRETLLKAAGILRAWSVPAGVAPEELAGRDLRARLETAGGGT
jgi:para-aminobenzoate synthetase component 1